MLYSNKNIGWVNTGRALSMLGIYIAHCNFYYLNLDSTILLFTNLFRIPFFYFISGFLFFRSLEKYSEKEKLKKIINKLIWPTIFFTSLIWLPKMLVHGKDTNFIFFVKDVLGGTASWFISSIIVGQLLLLFVRKFIKNIFFILGIGFIFFLLAFYLVKINPDPFPWYYKSGLMSFFFLSLGGVLFVYYDKIKKIISYKLLIISFIISLIMHCFTFNNGIFQNISLVRYDNIPLGLFNNIIGIFFMLQLCHYIPEIKWLQYIGKNSMLFYFLGGGVPLLLGYIVKSYIPLQGYIMTICIIILSMAIVFPISYIINKYFSWTLDFSKITKLVKK